MNSVLLWFGVLLAAVLTALFAVPQFIDWTLYRGQFEAEASRMLGREVRVGGSVSVSILPAPRMSFGRVRVADVPLDPSEPPGEPILRAESLELGLGISGLLRGELDVHHIAVVRPEVRLSFGADGRGNWQTLAGTPAQSSVMPGDITIANLVISGGRVRVTGPTGQDLLTLNNIDGEVEQVLGSGPLRFRGSLDWAGERHELRVSSAEGEPGGVKLRATVRALQSGNTVSFDGGLSDLAKIPRVTGDVVAKVATVRRTETGGSAVAGPGAFELRARVEGDGRAARLDNVSFSFEREGQPQLVTGSVDVRWVEGLDIAGDLQSRWIDIDRIVGPGTTLRPTDIAVSFARSLDAMLPDRGRFRAKIAVDQMTLAGEAVSGLNLAVAGTDGRLAVDQLEAGLPGGGAIRLSGLASADASEFDGRLLIRAVSSARLLAWAAKGSGLDADGPFILDGALKLTDRDLRFEAVRGEIGGQPVSGSIVRRFGLRTSLAVALEADDLDLSGVAPGLLDIGRLLAVLRGEKMSSDSTPAVYRWLDAADNDLSIRLKAGRIGDGTGRVTDVDADVALAADGISVRRLRFTGADDLAVTLAGDLVGVASVGRKGTLAWTVAAPSDAAVRRLASAFGLTEGLAGRPLPPAPLRLAGNVMLPAASEASADLTFDGRVRATRVRGMLRGPRLIDRWQSEPVDIDLEFDGPDALALIGIGTDRRGRDPASGSSRLTIRLAGSAAKGLIVKARGEGSSTGTVAFDGRLVAGEKPVELTGKATVDVRDGEELARLARLPFAAAFRDVAAAGTVGILAGPEQTTFALDKVKLAGTSVSGTVVRSAKGPVDAALVAERVALRDLLGAISTAPATPATPVTPAASATAVAVAGGPADTASLWSDAPFDTAAMLRLDGKLTLVTPRLEFDRGAALQDVRLEIVGTPGRVEMKSISANLLEGRLTGSLRLAAHTAEVSLDGELNLADADLSALAPGTRPAARGQASARLSMSGRGLTPRSLIQFAGGKGSVELRNVQLPGLSPLAVQRASQQFLATEASQAQGQLGTLVRNALSQGILQVGSRTLPIEISSGALKVGELKVETPDAAMINRTTVDLTTFRTDSEWRAEARTRDVGTKRKDPLPPVTIVYSGPAWDVARSEPRVQAEDLNRELAVRLMERDVDELERLRRLDEQRAREEVARRQAIEQAQAAEAAAQAAAAAAQRPAAPPPGTVLPGAVISTPLPPPTPPAPATAAEAAPPPAPKPSPKPATKSSDWWGMQYLFPK